MTALACPLPIFRYPRRELYSVSTVFICQSSGTSRKLQLGRRCKYSPLHKAKRISSLPSQPFVNVLNSECSSAYWMFSYYSSRFSFSRSGLAFHCSFTHLRGFLPHAPAIWIFSICQYTSPCTDASILDYTEFSNRLLNYTAIFWLIRSSSDTLLWNTVNIPALSIFVCIRGKVQYTFETPIFPEFKIDKSFCFV